MVLLSTALLLPGLARASTGCDGVNAGYLNVTSTWVKGTTTPSTNAKTTFASGQAVQMVRSAVYNEANVTNFSPNNSTFVTFDAGDIISYTVTVSGLDPTNPGTSFLRSSLRIGTGPTTFTAANGQNSVNNETYTRTYTILSTNTALGLVSGASSDTPGGTMEIVATCTPIRASVVSLSPNAGPVAGGNTVTLTGSGFTGVTDVAFGATPAASYAVNSSNQITAIAPGGAAGTTNVTVTTSSGGTSSTSPGNQYTYAAVPTVTALSPSIGVNSGGTTVVLTGTGLAGATSVSFGGTPAASFTNNSASQITAVSPAGSGTVNVVVTTSGGSSASAPGNQFTYRNPPPAPVVTAPANAATTGTTPTYAGSAGANLSVNVYVDNSPIGTVTSTGSGTWSLAQPVPLSSGSHTVYANATDSNGFTGPNSSINTFSVTAPPVANNYTLPAGITYNAGADTPTVFSIAGQASNSPASYAVGSSTTAQSGTVSINNAGTVTYTAARGFRGTDSFTYTASNAGGTSNAATVTLTVNNPSLSGTLAGSGTRGAPLSAVRVVPAGGTQPYSCATTLATGALPAGTQLNSDCSITGTPAASGSFTFTANITDSSTPAFTQATSQLTLVISVPSLSLTPPAGALPGATAGAAYSQSLAASGGTSPYSYSLTTGTLPPGLTLTGGTISGTPSAVGNYPFTIRATDSSTAGSGGPYSVTNSYSIAVTPPAITLSPATLPNGGVGTPYTSALSATGGNGTYAYAATGTLPPGVTLGSNGAFSGTPTNAGTFNFTVTATDSGTTGPAAPYGGSQAYTVTIAAPTITVSPAALTAGSVGQPYSVTFSAAGGTAGYTFATTDPLPAGMTLAANGTLSGTPSQGGSFAFTVIATDSSSGTGYTGSRSYTLNIAAPTITLAPATLTNPVAGQPYTAVISASGGTAGYTFTAPGGGLPPGLSLASDGTISGTPSGGGTFTFTVIATDSSVGTQYTGSRSYTLTVSPATIVVNPATLPSNAAGTPYSQTLSASGGNGTYTFAVTAGALPPGWSLSPSGTLSGTTSVANVSYTFTITATDQSVGTRYSGSRSYTVIVGSPNFTLTSPTLSATVGIPYSGNFVAGGGTAPYTYTRNAGTVPPGLVFASDGTLSGTPTASGSFSFTVIARDSTTGPGAPYGVGSGYSFSVAAPAAPVAANLTGVTVPYASGGTPIDLSGSITGVRSSVAIASAPAHGTTSISGEVVTYTPAAGYFGSDSFTYTATGPGGTSAPATVSLSVATPGVPVAANVSNVAVPYNSAGTAIDLTSAITGVHTSIAVATNPAHGTVTVSGDIVTYIPTSGYFGTDSFTYTATGPGGTSAPGTVTLEVAVPAAPTSGDISNVAVPYNSSGNAIDLAPAISGVRTGVAIATNPAHGTVTLAGEVATYIPATGYFGADSFTYTATGPGGTSAPATVTVQVAVPAAPTTSDIANVAVPYESSGTAIDLANAINGVHTSTAIATNPAHGTVTVSGDVVTYIPANGYFGTDSFTYTATGPGGTSAPATVTVQVATPAVPTSGDISNVAVPYNSAGTAIDLAPAISGVRTSVVIATNPGHGAVTLAGDVVTYIPTPGYFGTDSFTYTATGPGGTSTPGTVTVQVAVPSAPITGDISNVAVPYNSGGTAIDLAPAISGVRSGVAIATNPAHGTVTLAGDVVTYIPATGYFGTDSFTYTATGPGGTSTPGTVTVQVTMPAAPTTGDISNVAVPYNSSGTAIDLAPAISGVRTGVAIATNPAHGAVTLAGETVTYIPTPGYFGTDSFTYTATGPGGTSSPATVTVQVAVPAAPASGDIANVAVPYNSGGTAIDLAPAISGVRTSVAIATNPAHGTVTLAGDVVTYIPTAGYSGTDSFTYAATGPGGTSTPGTVTVQIALPPAPSAADRSAVAIPYNGGATPIDLTADLTGVYTAIALTTAPANGTTSVNGTVVTYTPNTDYFGADEFTYTVTGPGGTSRPVRVGLVIAPPPPPQAENTSSSVAASTATTGDQSVDIDLSALVSGDYDRIEIQTQPAHGVVELRVASAARAKAAIARAAGQVIATYTPARGFAGTDSFTFVAIGPGGTSAPATVTVQVLGRVPAIPPRTAASGDGQSLSIDLTEGLTDGPFVDATILSVTPAAQATATIVASGTGASRQYRLDISPAARFGGTVVVTYTLSNAFGASAPATVTVTVTARPDPTADPNVRAISDAQAETTRRFARSQVSNFMRRTEQLHGAGEGSGGADMGISLNSRDGRGVVQATPAFDASALAITERMRPSFEDPALGQVMARREGWRAARPDQLGTVAGGSRVLDAAERNQARKAAGLAGDVQPLVQDDEPNGDGARRVGSIGLWSGGAIDIGTQDATTDRSKITATTSGLSAGADLKLTDGVTIGIGGGYGNDLTRIDGGAARVRADSSIVALYASVMPLENGFLDFMAGRGDLSFRTRRLVAETNAIANGSRDGSFTVLAMALGIDRRAGALNWSLYGRGEVLDATLGRYVENGASRYDLRFDERRLSSITGTLGARIEFRQKYGFGIMTPRLRAEWNHEFADADAQRLDYADIGGSAFYGIETRGWSREQFQLGLGTRLVLPSLWSLDLETVFRASAGQRSGTLRAQISKEF